ncbi:MAG: DUF3467 domain-containing protein [bacterium]|nr:DUF3467 domain-containing protein [bacterium]
MGKEDKEIQEETVAIEISKELEKGVYSNVASIIHSQDEFILDFGITMPNRPVIAIQSRVITNPQHAKKFVLALQDNINKYEMKYGTIEIDGYTKDTQVTRTLDKLH